MTRIRTDLEGGRIQDALKHAKLEVKQNPLNAQAWVYIGDALDKLGRPYESWQAYRRGWLLDPSAAWAIPIQKRLQNSTPTKLDEWLTKALTPPQVTIAAVIIAKDEERSIKRCIESLTAAVDEIILIDTGSTDRTIQIAKDCGADIYQYMWDDDFSKARNSALPHVHSQWVIWVDADEWLDPEHQDAPRVAAGLFSTLTSPIALRIVQVNQLPDRLEANYDMSRMHPMGHGIHWRGRIHEQLDIADGSNQQPGKLPRSAVNIRLLHDGYNSLAIDRTAKLERNLKLLQKEVDDNPEDIASWGFLGRELLALGRLDESIESLKRAEELAPRHTWYGRLPEVRTHLIAALQMQGNIDEAHQVAIRGTQQNPEFPGHWFDRAKLELTLIDRHLKSAQEAFSQAERTAQAYRGTVTFDESIGRWRAKAGLADTAKLSGDLATARRIYKQLLTIEPGIEAVRILLATIEQQRTALNTSSTE